MLDRNTRVCFGDYIITSAAQDPAAQECNASFIIDNQNGNSFHISHLLLRQPDRES
jgi:hypothetical protein